MKRTLINITAAVILCLLASCYGYGPTIDPYIVDVSRQKENYYYAPQTESPPLLTKKNDISISGAVVSGDRTKGSSWHAAFVPSKHLGLTLNHYQVSAKSGGLGNMHNTEFGAGYYQQFSRNAHFETYGGYGTGRVQNFHYTGYSNLAMKNIFLQPTICVENAKQTFQLAFMSRFNRVSFSIRDTTFNNDREPIVTGQMKMLNDKPNQLFWEPGIVVRAGWPNVMLQCAYSCSAPLTNKDLFRSKDNFSASLIIRFNSEDLGLMLK